MHRGSPIVDGPASTVVVGADEPDAERRVVRAWRRVRLDKARQLGVADGAGWFTAGDRLVAIVLLQLRGLVRIVEGCEIFVIRHQSI